MSLACLYTWVLLIVEIWPLGVLLFGLLMLLLAVIGMFTGRTYGRDGHGEYRAKGPFNYWLELVVPYLCVAFMSWYWLYVLRTNRLFYANPN
jgi:hypothetical protein